MAVLEEDAIEAFGCGRLCVVMEARKKRRGVEAAASSAELGSSSRALDALTLEQA